MSNYSETNTVNTDESANIHISCLTISNRSKNALFRNGVFWTNDLLRMSREKILNMRGIGPNLLREIENALAFTECALPAEPNLVHLDLSEKEDFPESKLVCENEGTTMYVQDPQKYQWN